MTRPDYILVAPRPTRTNVANPGGQLTATLALQKFADAHGLRLAYIDTLQASFPPPGAAMRMTKALWRQAQFLYYATFRRPRHGVLIFSAGPTSFLERGVTGMLARVFGVRCAMCLRSGDIVPLIGSPSLLGRAVTGLMRLQPRIILQGSAWMPVLMRAGIGLSRVVVVPNWHDPAKGIAENPREASRSRPVRFVFVGWLVAEKGVAELIQACATLRAEGKSFLLVLVGDGTMRGELQRRIDEADLGEVITLTGWLKAPEVTQQLQASDVFVLPTYFEGFPNALLEAFSLGLPAIATTVGGIPDSLKQDESGFLVDAGDVEELTSAMRRYIEEPQLIRRHSAGALHVLREKHDFERNCRAFLASMDT